VPVAIDTVDKGGLAAFLDAFKAKHRQEYGYDVEGRDVELVNCRAKAVGMLEKRATHFNPDAKEPSLIKSRDVYFGKDTAWVSADIHNRERLAIGAELSGPCIIEEMSSTTVVHPGQALKVDKDGNLIITKTTKARAV